MRPQARCQGGSFALESGAAFIWNGWQACSGFSGRFGVEYAYIKTIGLYNTKARNIIKACEILVQQHQGKVPDRRDALEALPGVGRKTANVVLNTAFGQATIAVDTHIFRVRNRTGIAPGKAVLEVEKKLLKVVQKNFAMMPTTG